MDEKIYAVILSIVKGEHDENLNQITEAVRRRKDMLGQIKLIEFSVGQKVRFSADVRPTYLAGKEGVIVRKATKKVVVDLTERAGRFFKGISTPTNLLEVIPKE